MIEFILHRRWQPPRAQGYGIPCVRNGVMVIRIGVLVCQVRYHVHANMVQFHHSMVKPGEDKIFFEVGLDLAEGEAESFSEEDAEKFLREVMVPVFIAVHDGAN